MLEQFYIDNRLRLVKQMAWKLAGNYDVAEDVVQESFEKAIKYFPSFDPERGKLSTWFNTILYNVLRDYQTANKDAAEECIEEVSVESMINGGGIDRDSVERGQVLCKPGSVNPHTKFRAEAYILTKEEGGRHTPFFTNYRPQFYFRTTDVTGICALPDGTEMVMPGDNVEMTVELIVPIAMEDRLRFAIREGGRTVGAGIVAEIIE